MRTVKVVIIGNSGVGKTSLRGQYVSGQFSTAYRSTIGTDFITKTLPHYSKPDESVTLQIWDTAGQERFSSLSSAFFRGADAVILIFDVNQPETLRALSRWWSEFCACRPLSEGEIEDYCLVVVGNKTDLAPSSTGPTVSEEAASDFIDELVPLSGSPSSSLGTPEDEQDWVLTQGPDHVPGGSNDEVVAHDNGALEPGTGSPVDIILVDETHSVSVVHHNDVDSDTENSTPTFAIPPRTSSIDFHSHHHEHSLKAHSRTSQVGLIPNSTVSSTHTGFTSFQSFHTPTSSISDGYEPYHSAQSSPLSHSRSPSSSPSHRLYHSLSASTISSSTASTSIAPTITPARYGNNQHSSSQTKPTRPARGPKVFFTSAKTGAGVSEVFGYVARRVVMRWEWEEAHASWPVVGNGSVVHLADTMTGRKAFLPGCCSS